jgi:hypothetical protein
LGVRFIGVTCVISSGKPNESTEPDTGVKLEVEEFEAPADESVTSSIVIIGVEPVTENPNVGFE